MATTCPGSSRHLLELQVCAKGWRKLALPLSSFSLLLAISERPEHHGKIHVFLKMFLLCRGVVFLSLFILKKILCVREMKPERECPSDG